MLAAPIICCHLGASQNRFSKKSIPLYLWVDDYYLTVYLLSVGRLPALVYSSRRGWLNVENVLEHLIGGMVLKKLFL